MHTRTAGIALAFALTLVGGGCGLFESNDDELETLRAEVVQLREDVLDLETEVSLLAVSPPTTAAPVQIVTTTTRPKAASVSSVLVTTTTTRAWESVEPLTVETSETEVELILTAVYGWGPSSTAEALQTVLGIAADGWYGNQTRSAHLAVLEARGLSTDGVPVPPTTTTEVPLGAEEVEEISVEDEEPEAPAEAATTTEAPAEAATTTEAPAETTTTTEAPAETTTTTVAS